MLSFCFHCLSFLLGSFVGSCEFIGILLFIFFYLFFLLLLKEERLFTISYNIGLVVMNSFSFFLSGKVFICALMLNESFAG